MVWIFLLGVLALATYHKGFRKTLLWTSPLWLFAWFLIVVH
jgi:hypothetical protein